MPNDDNWGAKLKERVNNLIDRLYEFLAPEDCEYIGTDNPQGKVEVELHLILKCKKK